MRKFLSVLGWSAFVISNWFFIGLFSQYLRWGWGTVEDGKVLAVGFIFLLPLLIINIPAIFIIRKRVKST